MALFALAVAAPQRGGGRSDDSGYGAPNYEVGINFL